VFDNRPLVSIGLPTYNGERFIREALDSLLAQTYERIEIIISDNASTELLRSVANIVNDIRIFVISVMKRILVLLEILIGYSNSRVAIILCGLAIMTYGIQL
jgi:GT2 family glycosyltransferase